LLFCEITGIAWKQKELRVSNWFWLVFVVLALQPVVRQRFLEAMRARLIDRIEQQRGSRVISLVHRQETMSFLGIPVFRYIDVDDSEQILRAIHLTDPELPIDLVLHTPGGLALASTQIARALARHAGRVTVFVPHYAMSGGTLIALAADEIVMSEHAVLGPADPQIGGAPAASILRAVERKPIAEVDDDTLILADQSEMALNQLKQTIHDITTPRLPEHIRDALASDLCAGRWTHDYPVTVEEARKLGLSVSTEMPPEILQLMALYPQPVRRQPSVEYSPGRRGAQPPRAH
jgi:ClpP class serine protease